MSDIGFPFRPVHPDEQIKDELKYRIFKLLQDFPATKKRIQMIRFSALQVGLEPTTL